MKSIVPPLSGPGDIIDRGNGVTKYISCMRDGATECALMVEIERDSFKKIRHVNALSSLSFVTSGKPNMKAYVGLKDNGKPQMYLGAVSLEKSGWVYMNKVAIMAAGVVVFEKDLDPTTVERGRAGPFFAELAHFAVGDDKLAALRNIATSPDVLIRFSGPNSFASVPKEQVLNMQKTMATSLLAHDILTAALKGKTP